MVDNNLLNEDKKEEKCRVLKFYGGLKLIFVIDYKMWLLDNDVKNKILLLIYRCM